MRNIYQIIFLLGWINNFSHAQNTPIYALIDNKIAVVSTADASIESLTNIVGIPVNTRLANFTFHPKENVFYSIKNPSSSPTLVSITLEGTYQEKGRFMLKGSTIKLCETLSYHEKDNLLYAAVSLDGGVEDNDYYSESIVSVDPHTGACIFVAGISRSIANPDVDAMAFQNDVLYMLDGAPPGANFTNFYKIGFQGGVPSPDYQLIYSAAYQPITDFTVIDENLYFSSKQDIYKLNLSSTELSLVGQIYPSKQFNGSNILGISHTPPCLRAMIELGKDTAICQGSSLMLDASFPEASYLWQDGSTDAFFDVTKPGQYWVKVTNVCGYVTDSLIVRYTDAPVVDLGQDTTLCPSESLTVNLDYSEANIMWHDGITSSSRTLNKAGVYHVIVENACGSAVDSIRIAIKNLEKSFIPNVITPNNDGFNDYLILDEYLKGAQIEVFDRWGKSLFRSESYQNNWNGGGASAGVYYYVVKHACYKNYKGWIQLLRTKPE